MSRTQDQKFFDLFSMVLAALVVFTIAMIGYAGASILYTTSSVLQDYPDGYHVSAALALFSAVMLMFWYVLQLVMSIAGND